MVATDLDRRVTLNQRSARADRQTVTDAMHYRAPKKLAQAVGVGNPLMMRTGRPETSRIPQIERQSLMTEHSRPPVTPLGQALGRIPSGLYILTVSRDGHSTGMLASWVQQAGFEPPMLTVAVAKRRYVGDWLTGSGRFTLNQLPSGSKALIRHFGRGFEPEAPAFEGLTLLDLPSFAPVLAGSCAYLDAEVNAEIPSGDHRIFLATVVSGNVLENEAEPLVHVRHNGYHY